MRSRTICSAGLNSSFGDGCTVKRPLCARRRGVTILGIYLIGSLIPNGPHFGSGLLRSSVDFLEGTNRPPCGCKKKAAPRCLGKRRGVVLSFLNCHWIIRESPVIVLTDPGI